MHQESEQAFTREVWGLQGASYIVIALRYYSKYSIMGWHGLAWDDALMLVATLVYTAESTMAYLVVAHWKGLSNNAMTDAYRAALDPNSREWYLRVSGSKNHVAGLIIYATLLWLLKACWLVYYARLTEGINNMRLMIRWGIAIIGLSYIACLLVALFKCIPFDHQWQINPSPGNNCMPAISSVQTIFVMVMNTLTDFYIMAIPLPLVWKSHLPWKKKFVLLFMFSGGFLTMAFGILRCVSILTIGDSDPAQSGYWSVRESFVCVVLTNMPMVYALFRGYVEKGLSATRSKVIDGVNVRGYWLSSLRSRAATIGQKQKPPVSDPNDIAWGSEDHINAERSQGHSIDNEENSLNLPKHQVVGAAFYETGIPGIATQPMNGSRHIMVTTEYTVTEGARHDSRDFSKAEFVE
ncbi:hypothetical protein F4811DRAFT_573079 [Daldinia bambusicola]|nr:hypothetical protein F4811DRAFT_573079 [Daldinia bambusicola]